NQEPATGSVRGTVRLADSDQLFGEARIVLSPTGGYYRRDSSRKTWSRSVGTFVLPAVKEGAYSVSAYTESHHVDGGTIYVGEGETTHVELRLERSNPAIALSQHQWTFSTNEVPRIAIRGYTDFTRPKGGDSVKLKVYK